MSADLGLLALACVALALGGEWWCLHRRRQALVRASQGEADDASDEVQV
jgi:hypothetical protein